ncbi:hypothetical protein M0804_001668 [Polistes exclamans]|nr:hypothetical protein M0804_001668 [Polistes exclamans]
MVVKGDWRGGDALRKKTTVHSLSEYIEDVYKALTTLCQITCRTMWSNHEALLSPCKSSENILSAIRQIPPFLFKIDHS